MGSGTVAVAAERLGRDWVGIELNPDYAQLAEERIAKARKERHDEVMPDAAYNSSVPCGFTEETPSGIAGRTTPRRTHDTES